MSYIIQDNCKNIIWNEVRNIIKKLPSCNFILYASPGKEGFYESLGFSKLKTGMGLYTNMERMKNRGFIE